MPTVGDLFDAWLAHVTTRLEVATVISYRSVVRQLRPLVGARRLDDLTAAELDGVYVRLLEAGRSASTVHRHHRAMHAALRQAVRWGWLTANPADAATPPRVPRRRIRPPTASDVVRLIDAASRSSTPDLAVALRILVATGMRRGELCALRWRDIDPAAQTLRVEGAMVHGETGIVEKDTKTHAARRLSLDAGTVALLQRHREECQCRASARGRSLSPDAFVLANTSDGTVPWRPNRLTQAFARLRRQLGLDGVRLHDLRHFQATELIAAGVDVRTVAGRLGHADAATTLRIYAAFTRPADERAARIVGGLLDPEAGSP